MVKGVIGASTAKRVALAFPILAAIACGASMRPLPDEVSPLPRSAIATVTDAGLIHREDGGALAATGRHERVDKCDVRVRWAGTGRAVVRGDLAGALREVRSAGISEDVDQTGAVRGLRIDALEDGSCLAALGFQEQDVLLEINGYSLGPVLTRRQAFESVDDGDEVFAVIMFVRAGRNTEWRFDQGR